MKRLTYITVILLAVASVGCKQLEYVKNKPNKTAAEQLKDANFNAKEADNIIDYNARKKKKRNKMECKQRKADQEYLENLNKSTSKNKMTKQPVPFNFY